MIGAGLSLDQAPPISVPFRFFLAAPIFGILAGLSLFFLPPEVFQTRWSGGILALTHLLALGFILTTLMGAVFQILPVIAGTTIKRAVLFSSLILPFHLIGTLALCYGFLTADWKTAFPLIIFLILGILIFGIATVASLAGARSVSESVKGIRLSVISLLVTLALGVLLSLGESGFPLPFFRPGLTDLHLTQGLIGTIFLLVVSVSYQVIPMFYVTGPYPPWMRKRFVPATFSFILLNLFLTTAGKLKAIPTLTFGGHLLIMPIAFYCVTTLRLFNQRRRKTFDGSLWFWKTSMFSALGSLIFFISGLELWMGAFAIFSILAVVIGMLTKIIPFLIWFHLQTEARTAHSGLKVPHMKAIIPDREAKIAYGLFLITALLFFLMIINPIWFHALTGLSVCGLFSFLFAIILRSLLVYRRNLARL